MFIAVVCNASNLGSGCQHPCAITGTVKSTVIEIAIKHRNKMQSGGGPGPYEIYVGKLTQAVTVPVEYELVSMDV